MSTDKETQLAAIRAAHEAFDRQLDLVKSMWADWIADQERLADIMAAKYEAWRLERHEEEVRLAQEYRDVYAHSRALLTRYSAETEKLNGMVHVQQPGTA